MALKPTTCKEAIARWEKAKEEVAAEATVIELQFQWPPIEKMDGALSTLVACEKLSLSSNCIDKIAGIAGMKSLKILSLGRNNIKSLAGIETVADTLEELWISYNPIDKLKGIGTLKNLRVFYMSNGSVKEWVEFNRMQGFIAYYGETRMNRRGVYSSYDTIAVGNPHIGSPFSAPNSQCCYRPDRPSYPFECKDCPALRDLVFIGNPISDSQPDVDTWRTQVSNRLQQVTKLDGIPIIRE